MEHAIESSVHLAEPLGHVRAALDRDVGVLVAAETTVDRLGNQRFESSLAVEIAAGTQVQQAIVGEVGRTTRTDDAIVVSVRWQPASHEHVLPAFAGEFELTSEPPGTCMLLRGAYTVPLGPAGRVGDWAAGRRLAQRVLDRHLVLLAERLEKAAGDAAESAQEPPGPGPENFFG